MWTEPRYPNPAALKARPHSHVERACAGTRICVWGAGDGFASTIDMPWLTSGGKVTPVDGQEHPRTEL
jgi:hypothetical protein